MSKLNEKLESLTPSVRFFNQSRRQDTKDQPHKSINSIFLQKREIIEAEDFTVLPIKRHRGLSDAILPDTKIMHETHHYNFRRRRSTLLGFTEPPNLPLDQLDLLEVELQKEDCQTEALKVIDKISTRKRKDHEGFDFNEFTSKKNKDSKFVMKLNKNNENLKITDKGKSRRRNRGGNADEESVESIGKTDGIYEDNGAEDRQMGFVDEKQRLRTKINKVNIYWDKRTLHIPNVFRLARLIDDDPKSLLEFQDYSRKSVLVQGGSQKHKSNTSEISDLNDSEPMNDAMSFMQRRSFNMMLGIPEEVLNLFK